MAKIEEQEQVEEEAAVVAEVPSARALVWVGICGFGGPSGAVRMELDSGAGKTNYMSRNCGGVGSGTDEGWRKRCRGSEWRAVGSGRPG